jgi:hypothetical protein
MIDRDRSQERLDRLASEFAEDLLAMSDAEVLQELEGEESLESIMVAARQDLVAVAMRVGKANMAIAKAGVRDNRAASKGGSHISLSMDGMRERILEMAQSFGLGDRLTLAARNGQSIPDADLAGLLEDLTDLGADLKSLEEK